MTKKGFTLIELLAVIVVLAIIALIVTPVISKLIGNAKEQSNIRSVEGHIWNVTNNLGVKLLENKYLEGIYTFNELGLSNYPASDTIRCESYKVKGGKVVKAINCNIDEKEYCYDKQARTCAEDETILSEEDLLAPTLYLVDSSNSSETYKGIAYLNPTNFERTCSEKNLTLNDNGTTTTIKDGCMKWYIFKESDTTYTMISDHNVFIGVRWKDSDGVAIQYADSVARQRTEELSSVYGWKVVPRLITGSEIYSIIGAGWFYDNSSTSKRTFDAGPFDAVTRNKYAWLFDNTAGCKTSSTDRGCNIEDGNLYLGDDGTTKKVTTYYTGSIHSSWHANVWCVTNAGALDLVYTGSTVYGSDIRPVITVDKTIFD